MKHVYLGILFVMNCFWADLCGWDGKWEGGEGGGEQTREKGELQMSSINGFISLLHLLLLSPWFGRSISSCTTVMAYSLCLPGECLDCHVLPLNQMESPASKESHNMNMYKGSPYRQMHPDQLLGVSRVAPQSLTGFPPFKHCLPGETRGETSWDRNSGVVTIFPALWMGLLIYIYLDLEIANSYLCMRFLKRYVRVLTYM